LPLRVAELHLAGGRVAVDRRSGESAVTVVQYAGHAMKRTWTIIGVRDVPDSCQWYQSLFGQPGTAPSHDHFGQIVDTDGTVLLCLHRWGAHEHPSLTSPDEAPPGNGLLLFFRVDDFDMALQRARALVARLDEEPHLNPNTQTMEFSLRDPDGYYVTVSALSAPRR
jgi:catechol 2,3-dioxygenase-like lactoylglutathione lyase family enzyme